MIAGRTVAELVELSAGMVVIARLRADRRLGAARHRSLETLGAFGLLLLMAFAVTWAGVWIGLMVRDPDGADGIAMTRDLPDDVPERDLRAGRRPAGRAAPDRRAQPADVAGHGDAPALRLARPARSRTSGRCSTRCSRRSRWAAVLMAVFVPLSVRRYKRMGR